MTPEKGPRLTREQLDSWQSFGGEWASFKTAWLAKGFLWAPSGSVADDERTSLRSFLHQILTDRPTDLPRWVQESCSHSPYDVVGDVFMRWRTVHEAAQQTDLLLKRARERDLHAGERSRRLGVTRLGTGVVESSIHALDQGTSDLPRTNARPVAIGEVLRTLNFRPRERPADDGQTGADR